MSPSSLNHLVSPFRTLIAIGLFSLFVSAMAQTATQDDEDFYDFVVKIDSGTWSVGKNGKFRICEGLIMNDACVQGHDYLAAVEGRAKPAQETNLRKHVKSVAGPGYRIVDTKVTARDDLYVYLKEKKNRGTK